ncbi:DUF1636 family protein [Yoonia sp.]|uniref:DUF1636 family protein n=1 Tax=Yoonia sp. TaxID=2212373 RepID=UPI0025DAAE66|nr:DUF1636 family protein [Yoonia sp.]
MIKRLTICETCAVSGAYAQGAALADAMRGLTEDGWELQMHACLSVCAEPVAVAVQAQGKATYVFAGVTSADAADLAVFTRLYDAAPDGWIDDARPAGRLRFCLKSRVPAL